MKKLFTFVAAALFAVSMNAITVAEALQIAGQLEQGATTEVEYEIEGYVTAMQGSEDGGWAKYGNQIFWIADEQGTAASNADGALEIYQGVSAEQVFLTDKVSVKAKLTNYQGLLETVKKGVVTIIEKNGERPEPGEEADVVFTGNDFTGQGTSTTGSPVSATKDGVTFTCDKGYNDDSHATLRCYKNGVITITSETEQIGKLVFQFYQTYTGDLETEVVVNANTWTYTLTSQARIEKLEIYFGEFDPIEPVVLEPITVNEALQIAQALTPQKGSSATTVDKYAVKGYVVGISSKTENTFYLADEAGAYGEFEAYKCASVDAAVAEGDLVIVTGRIQHYWGEGDSGEFHSYEISGGTLVHASGTGIENVTLTEKAQKVMIDGVIYILRGGKIYTLEGTEVE
jgi:hypothetical protein